ncbi:probable malate dehydrogenase, mitochondrial [Pseudomyrmex gracilis]|uniref:probable malate dehydrogenase, mitochondrial n=1 Tax=Pseudomyrmex gracilis TaxID=219809 RepID=UPI000995322E|nr:probable malate dehydrogenase, mitochondrial [Pseudomyrmex gracilis]
MAVSTRYFPNLLQQCKRYPVLVRCEFSKGTNDKKKHEEVDKENTKRSIKQEEYQNKMHDAQKDRKPNIRVCIIGGGVTPLYTAVLLKQYQNIKNIHLVDTRDTVPGAMASVCHTETYPRIDYFRRKDIKEALKKVNIVALMDEMDIGGTSDTTPRVLFKSAADYVRQMTDKILRFCPNALVAVFARPVTAMLPMVSEIFRCSGCFNPDRIIGSVSTYKSQIEDATAALLNLEREFISIPMAGGADARTVVPLLSRAFPFNQFTNAQRKTLLQSFRVSDEITAKHDGPSLSSGTAAAKLIIALANGLNKSEHVTCAYVRSNTLPICRFFTNEVQLGPEGIKRVLDLPKVSPAEILMIEHAIPLINEYVDMAVAEVRTEKIRAKTR